MEEYCKMIDGYVRDMQDLTNDMQELIRGISYIKEMQELVGDMQRLIDSTNHALNFITKSILDPNPLKIMNPLHNYGEEFEFSNLFELTSLDFVKSVSSREGFYGFRIKFTPDNKKVLVADFSTNPYTVIVGYISGKDPKGILDKFLSYV